MGWHCPKSLLFIEIECSFNIKETWSEFRWGPRLDLKHICPPVQCKTTFKHQASVNQLFLVQRTVQTTNLPFATGLFKKCTTITKFVEKKTVCNNLPRKSTSSKQKRWKILSFPRSTWVSNPTNLQSRQVHHNTGDLPWLQVIQRGKIFFWATKLHYCCYMFPVKFSCLGGVQKKIQCSGIWRKTA